MVLDANAAREAMVLLKNDDGFLPLDITSYKSVAVVGPCADDPTCNRGVRVCLSLPQWTPSLSCTTASLFR